MSQGSIVAYLAKIVCSSRAATRGTVVRKARPHGELVERLYDIESHWRTAGRGGRKLTERRRVRVFEQGRLRSTVVGADADSLKVHFNLAEDFEGRRGRIGGRRRSVKRGNVTEDIVRSRLRNTRGSYGGKRATWTTRDRVVLVDRKHLKLIVKSLEAVIYIEFKELRGWGD